VKAAAATSQPQASRLAPGAVKIVRNALAQAGSQILLTPVNLIYVVLVARTLGPDGYGIYQLAQSFPALVGAAIPLGMNVYFSRDLAQRPQDAPHYATYGYGLALVAGVLGYVVLQIAAVQMGFAAEVRSVILVSGVIAVAGALATLTGSFFRAFERLQLDAFLVAGERLAGILLGVVALFFWKTPLALVGGLLIAALARLVVSQVVIRRAIGPFGIRFDRTESLRMVGVGWPFLLAGYCSIFIDNIGVSVLGSVGSTSDVGTYAAAWRLVVFGTVVALAFANATLPMLARAAIVGQGRIAVIVDNVVPGLAFVAALGASLLALLAQPLVAVIYGERFSDVPVVLQTLLLVLPAVCVSFFAGNALMSAGQQPFIMRLLLVVALAGLGLNVLLARAAGPRGVAIVLVLVDYAICFGYLWRLHRVGASQRVRLAVAAWLLGLAPGVIALQLPLPAIGQVTAALGIVGLGFMCLRRPAMQYVRSVHMGISG
jgi:O-antigen/teichoic acid export membrane protein